MFSPRFLYFTYSVDPLINHSFHLDTCYQYFYIYIYIYICVCVRVCVCVCVLFHHVFIYVRMKMKIVNFTLILEIF